MLFSDSDFIAKMPTMRAASAIVTPDALHYLSRITLAGLLACALALPSNAAQEQARVALVIGNAAYGTPAWNNLSAPERDADAMAARLTALGFQVIERKNQDLIGMTRALGEFKRVLESKPGTLGLFYYSGHGAQARGELDSSEKNHLIPARSDLDEERDASAKALSLDTVLEVFDQARVSAGIAVIDACRNNGLHHGNKASEKGFAAQGGRPGTLIAFATGPNSTAADDEAGLSPYTRRLVTRLGTPGEGLIGTFMAVAGQVRSASGERQRPVQTVDLETDIVLVGGATVVSTPAPAASAGSLTVTSDPAGIDILVGGVYRGQAPLTLSDIPVGHAVTVRGERAGYSPYEKRVQVSSGQALTLELLLSEIAATPNSGTIEEPAPSAQRSTVTQPTPLGMSAADIDTLTGAMVEIKGGKFRMGDSVGNGSTEERPVHDVRVKSFRLAAYDVTFEQYDAYAKAADKALPDDHGWDRGKRPVINVSFEDAQAYIQWLNQRTGSRFRLPSVAEWEYAARAGTTTQFYWGDTFNARLANSNQISTTPVGQSPPNPWGLYDMSGNVWQWTQDCQNESYVPAPANGSEWTSGSCARRAIRGGSRDYGPANLRVSDLSWYDSTYRNPFLGFRLAQDR